jgi:hypothetical protein
VFHVLCRWQAGGRVKVLPAKIHVQLPCTVNNTFSRNALATACVSKLSDCCTRRFESSAKSALLKTK